MKNLIIILLSLLPFTVSAQLLRSYGVVEIGSSFPFSTSTGAKFAYRTTDSSYYRWVHTNYWVKVVEPSIIPDTLYLTEELGTTVKLSGDTIHLTPYLLKSDTSSMLVRYIERGDTLGMLSAYIRSAGWGLLKSSYTLRADSTLLATRSFARNLPTYIANTRIAYSNGSNLVGSPSLTFTGGNAFNVSTGLNSGVGYTATNTSSLGSAESGYYSFNNAGAYIVIGASSSTYTTNSTIGSSAGFIFNNLSNGFIINSVSGNIRFATGSSPGTERARITSSGNLIIGTTTDVATSILTARSSTKASSPFPLQTLAEADAITGIQGNFQYETTQNGLRGHNGTRKFYALESTFARGSQNFVPFFDANGQVVQSTNFQVIGSRDIQLSGTNARLIFTGSIAQGGVMSSGTTTLRISGGGSGSSTNYNSIALVNLGDISSGNVTATSGTINLVVAGSSSLGNRIDATSGSLTYNTIVANPGINTTGTYSGIIRGFYYSPTVLSATGVDERAIETARGNIIMQGSGRLGIGTTSPQRSLHVAGSARITGSAGTATAVMGRDANGDISNLSISSDLKLASGTLGLKHKSLIDSLPLASVAIDAAGNDLSLNSLGTLTIDFDATAGSIVSDGDITTIESDSEINLVTGQDAVLNLTDMVNLHAPNADGVNAFRIQSEGFFYNFVNTSADPDSAFSIITDGDRKLIRAHAYGNGYVDATYTGEYPGKYILATTANHNVMDYRIDRDTLVVDANLSVGTLLYYTQNLHINLRMTALAATNSTVTFPDAAEVFRGKSIYVRVLEKDPGIYVPVINVSGGGSRLLYTSTTTTAPTDQSNLTMDNSTWPFFRTYKFTCLNTGTTPDYRWVLDQY